MEIKFKTGSLVKALCGREYSELFIIVKIEGNYAYLSNGKSRPIEKPKKKNIKHLYKLLIETPLSEMINNSKITNGDIIKYLKDYIKLQK